LFNILVLAVYHWVHSPLFHPSHQEQQWDPIAFHMRQRGQHSCGIVVIIEPAVFHVNRFASVLVLAPFTGHLPICYLQRSAQLWNSCYFRKDYSLPTYNSEHPSIPLTHSWKQRYQSLCVWYSYWVWLGNKSSKWL